MGGNFFARLFDRISLDRQLDQANAECMQKGIIFGVHLSYCEAGMLSHEDTDAIELSVMVEHALSHLAHLRRYSQFCTQHYFIGMETPYLREQLEKLQPEKTHGNFFSMAPRDRAVAFPDVYEYDPHTVGVAQDVARIESALKAAGIASKYIDGQVKVFFLS